MPRVMQITNELTEVYWLWGLSKDILAIAEVDVKTPLAVATTNPEQYRSGISDVLCKAGWHCVGRHKNPNHGHEGNYLWVKRFKRPGAECVNYFGDYSPGCCGLRYWTRTGHIRSSYMVVRRNVKGEKLPSQRYWQCIAQFSDCSYWTNAKMPKDK